MEGWHGKFYPYKKGGERIFHTEGGGGGGHNKF